MKIDDIRTGIDHLRHSLADGWQRLRESAASALTRFSSDENTRLPAQHEVDDSFFAPSRSWSMLGGEVFEDETRIVVRLEVPGMSKQDFDIRVDDDTLVVQGEKRFEREGTDGRWRVMQCAYGSFRRAVALPSAVQAEASKASYRSGVLRIELPKAQPGRPRAIQVPVA
ncbi:MAG: Hsp20/alpha crystallin family protein [Rhodocyclaceae bacterium]|nr:Hsp20/alpha crystallin family protein [Rhodocyclaceae bacterium]